MYGTEVELDTLSDTDRAGAENEDFSLLSLTFRLIFTSEAGIVVRSLCRELSCAGIYHLERCADVVVMAHLLDLVFCETCESCDHVIRELDAFCVF